MNFVHIGNTLVNLDNVTSMEVTQYDNRACIRISFIGGIFTRVYHDQLGTYEELVAWIEQQPRLTQETID
jgi:hypothetical protein